MSNQLPDKDPQWADTGVVVEPSAGKKTKGWETGERPPAQYFNWWMLLVYQWILVLRDLYRGARTLWTENWRFASANLGPGSAVGWDYDDAGGQYTPTVEDPDSTMRARYLKFTGNGSSGVITGNITSEYFHYFTDTSDVDVEFDACLPGATASASYTVEFGLQFSGGAARRITLVKTNALTNWNLHVEAATPGGTTADTTIAPTTNPVRVRFSYRGNAGSNSTVKVYLDGVLGYSITSADVPKNDKARFYVLRTGGNGGLSAQQVGPISVRAAKS